MLHHLLKIKPLARVSDQDFFDKVLRLITDVCPGVRYESPVTFLDLLE